MTKKEHVLTVDQLLGLKQNTENKISALVKDLKSGRSKYLKGELNKLDNLYLNLNTIKATLALANLKINPLIYELKQLLEKVQIIYFLNKSKTKNAELEEISKEAQEKITDIKKSLNEHNKKTFSKLELYDCG